MCIFQLCYVDYTNVRQLPTIYLCYARVSKEIEYWARFIDTEMANLEPAEFASLKKTPLYCTYAKYFKIFSKVKEKLNQKQAEFLSS